VKRAGPLNEMALEGSPCSQFTTRVMTAYRAWGELEAAVRPCFVDIAGSQVASLDPFELIRVLKTVRQRPDLVSAVGESLVEQTEREARHAADLSVRNFDADLRQLCARDAVALTGRFPTYNLAGFLTVRLDLDKSTCSVGSRKLRTLLIGRVWLAIAEEIGAERRRRKAPEEFLIACEHAYRRAIVAAECASGTAIPVKELLRALQLELARSAEPSGRSAKRSPAYTEEHFRRDLSGLIAAGKFVSSGGSRMELLPTAFAKEGIPVSAGDGIRYIGRIAFELPEL
jgi:hypothetical protein